MPTQMMHLHLDSKAVATNDFERRVRQKAMQQKGNLAMAWKQWLADLAPWTHAITLTFKRRGLHQQVINEKIMSDAIKHFLLVLNRKCFKRSAIRKGMRIPVVAVIGWGAYKDHPHAHLCLVHPQHIDYPTFCEYINFSADRTEWMNNERDIRPYRTTGWIAYLVDHGIENIIGDLTTAH